MGLVIVLALLVLLFLGIGFAVHLLWIVAVVLFLVWIIGFFVRGVEPPGQVVPALVASSCWTG